MSLYDKINCRTYISLFSFVRKYLFNAVSVFTLTFWSFLAYFLDFSLNIIQVNQVWLQVNQNFQTRSTNFNLASTHEQLVLNCLFLLRNTRTQFSLGKSENVKQKFKVKKKTSKKVSHINQFVSLYYVCVWEILVFGSPQLWPAVIINK